MARPGAVSRAIVRSMDSRGQGKLLEGLWQGVTA